MALFDDPSPKEGDEIPVLWKKINQIYSDQNGGAHPPVKGDWEYNSIFKIAQILSGS